MLEQHGYPLPLRIDLANRVGQGFHSVGGVHKALNFVAAILGMPERIARPYQRSQHAAISVALQPFHNQTTRAIVYSLLMLTAPNRIAWPESRAT